MVKVRVCHSPCQSCHSPIAPEQKDVPSVSLVKKLGLAEIVEPPRLVTDLSGHHFLANVALRVPDALPNIILPLETFLDIPSFEYEFLITVHYFNSKHCAIVCISSKGMHEMVEIQTGQDLVIALLLVIL